MNANILTFLGGLTTVATAKWVLNDQTAVVAGLGASLQTITFVIGLIAMAWALKGPKEIGEALLDRVRARRATSTPPEPKE